MILGARSRPGLRPGREPGCPLVRGSRRTGTATGTLLTRAYPKSNTFLWPANFPGLHPPPALFLPLLRPMHFTARPMSRRHPA